MLSYQLANNHAGIMLIGDYTSLRLLHEVVHDVNLRSPLIEEQDGPFLALAFDARKAYEQEREIIVPPDDCPQMGVRYGVKILWPVLLLQQRMLRVSLAYLDHAASHQAITYALESVIEQGLRADFGSNGQSVVDQWRRLTPRHSSDFEKLRSRGALFCTWSKSARKRNFAELLASFDPMFELMHDLRAESGQLGFLSPEVLDSWAHAQWADPRM